MAISLKCETCKYYNTRCRCCVQTLPCINFALYTEDRPTVRYGQMYSSPAGAVIEKVIFNYPATIVIWGDKTKTVVKCQEGEIFDPEKGLAMAIAKRAMGNKGSFNNEFKKWIKQN